MVLAFKKIGIVMESLAPIEPLLPSLNNRVLTDIATQLWAESIAAVVRNWLVGFGYA